MKINFRFTNTALAFIFAVHTAKADIAIRDIETPEREFQSLALAFGHETVAEFLTSDEGRTVLTPPSTLELFEARLIDAQTEWLQRNEGVKVGAATERFLKLSLEADWSSAQRQAFVTFYQRKIELATAGSVEKSMTALKDFTFMEALEEASNSNADAGDGPSARSQFPTPLPQDVVGALINGVWVSHAKLATMRFPLGPVRVTLISNAYQPETLGLRGTESDWPMLSRKPWVTANCSLAPLPASYGATDLKVLGLDRCRARTEPRGDFNGSNSRSGDRGQIENFGLARGPIDSLPAAPSKTASIMRKPWFWGVIGVVAVGTVIALQRSQDQTVRPTGRDGW